uniref:Uncharacterized protein n=1 Tax=Cucumis melo TaxID=3656 RepID=A0A9I9EHP3_CUCME
MKDEASSMATNAMEKNRAPPSPHPRLLLRQIVFDASSALPRLLLRQFVYDSTQPTSSVLRLLISFFSSDLLVRQRYASSLFLFQLSISIAIVTDSYWPFGFVYRMSYVNVANIHLLYYEQGWAAQS